MAALGKTLSDSLKQFKSVFQYTNELVLVRWMSIYTFNTK
jgi:hypothetical protein